MPGYLKKLPLHQLANQLIFLYVGKLVYKLSVTWVEIATILLISATLEHLFLAVHERKLPKFSPAALSTGFNLAFMLGATSIWVYATALLVGLGQKHGSKYLWGRHFQNPSNVGIVAALLLFPNLTFVTFTDWGVTPWFALLIMGLGTFLLWRVGLVFVPYVFLAAYTAFQLLLHTHSLQAIALHHASAGFLLFSFFMITDPKAVPVTKPFLVVYAVMTAFLCNLLPLLLGGKEVNLFLALLLSGCLVPLWLYLEKQPRPLRRTALGASYAVLTFLAGMAYFSPTNVLRNVFRTPDFHPATISAQMQPDARDATATSATLPEIWGAPDEALYQKTWQASHVVKREFGRNASQDNRFTQVPLPSTATAMLTPEMLGDETRMFAGVAVGDLNLDGYLDTILSRVGSPIQILINDRKGGFADLTQKVFPAGAPANVEQMALADFNNDTRLDLLLVFSQYYGLKKPATIYWFDPVQERFLISEHANFAAGKKTSGGISVYDLNGDKKLDFYISFGIDWFSEDLRKTIDAAQDVLYLSEKSGWQDRHAEFFDTYLSQQQYAGMTALFTDFDLDGIPDFLLGNDFDDPSFALRGRSRGGFDLFGRGAIENNTQSSMSYFAADFDNDGVLELWENGVAEALTPGRLALQKTFAQTRRSLLNQELEKLEKEKELGTFTCNDYRSPLLPELCRDTANITKAALTHHKEYCDKVIGTSARHACKFALKHNPTNTPPPNELKYDVELYPKQLRENVLLRLDADAGHYVNVIKNNPDAGFTGFTWCGYPFDVNNDGLLDIYVTNGMAGRAHNSNRLLINDTPVNGAIRFEDRAPGFGVDFENDGRGAVLADFDLDGDGDLLVNNYLADAEFYQNQTGGKSLLIDLRSTSANYYAIGAVIRLVTETQTLTRQVTLGGHWNTSQPAIQHFGIPQDQNIQFIEVRWPNGNVSKHTDIEPGFRYVIYE